MINQTINTKRSELNIPLQYLMQFISKEMRVELFKHIANGYVREFPQLRRLIAYLNWDEELNLDYLILFKANNRQNKKFILYDMVSFGNMRSIPGFRYCVLNDKSKDFFVKGFKNMVPLEEDQFASIMIDTLGLSFNHSDANYWKKCESISKMIPHLTEIAKCYNPQIIID